MQNAEFRTWLTENGYLPNVVNSRVTNCETVCRYEGDLDDFFEEDECEKLLQRLCYTADDERNHRPVRHSIPINGNQRTGSATLKQAVNLYVKFRKNIPIQVKEISRTTSYSSSTQRKDWPVWDKPNEEECYQLAQIITRYVRFLSPEIVEQIVKFNELIKDKMTELLKNKGVDPSLYLWEKSSCCFPGIRRYAGSSEISAFRKRSEISEIENAVLLDDNDFPKQIWSFVFRGCQFNKCGPDGYGLAHLIDHKKDKNRMLEEFIFPEGYKFENPVYGLYTCASNSVYIPNNLMKPTDFNGEIRNLLFRKAYQLYSPICNIVPPFIKIPEASDSKWDIEKFTWADPVGTTENITDFNIFRAEKLVKNFVD